MYLKGMLPSAFIHAFIGSTLFTWLCFRRKIYAESFLQLFYMGMALYGYFSSQTLWEVSHWTLTENIPWIMLGAFIVYLTGRTLKSTDAQTPYLDAFTTIYSLIATWLMVNFIHENWLYWMVIDAVSIVLYARRKMYFGALLFFIYLLMAIDGYVEQISWF